MRRRVLAMTLAVAAATSVAEAKTILVIGTHPDDETLMSAGRSRTAFTAGDTSKVAIVTNGDANGVTTGLNREAQAVGSAQALGLREQDVIFLGYPDASMRDIYDSTSGTQVFTSQAGQTCTYGNRGLGGTDYHRYLTGVCAPYHEFPSRRDLHPQRLRGPRRSPGHRPLRPRSADVASAFWFQPRDQAVPGLHLDTPRRPRYPVQLAAADQQRVDADHSIPSICASVLSRRLPRSDAV